MNHSQQAKRSSRSGSPLHFMGEQTMDGTSTRRRMDTDSGNAWIEGSVKVLEGDAARVHTYTAPGEGLLVNTHVVETDSRLVVVDGQFLLPYATEVADYIERLGKPVERFVLSHVHVDREAKEVLRSGAAFSAAGWQSGCPASRTCWSKARKSSTGSRMFSSTTHTPSPSTSSSSACWRSA